MSASIEMIFVARRKAESFPEKQAYESRSLLYDDWFGFPRMIHDVKSISEQHGSYFLLLRGDLSIQLTVVRWFSSTA